MPSWKRNADPGGTPPASLALLLTATLGVLLLVPGCGPAQPAGAAPPAAADAGAGTGGAPEAPGATGPETVLLEVEKDELRFGFIKLTDCAPLVIALEKGYFEDEGLVVELEAQANWKVLLDRVISGELDGAHMLAGQPIGATVGFGTQAHVVTAYSLDYNGNGITVSNALWEKMKPRVPMEDGKPVHPITAEPLVPVVKAAKEGGELLRMGMVFPVSTHNYEIRYWLGAAGINPGFYYDPANREVNIPGVLGAEVELSVTPPPQMPATLEAGTIAGYCVGEPWNQQAVFKKIGVPVTTNYDIWKNNPEKVFGVSKAWADAHPETWVAVTKALIRAGHWLDAGGGANRQEAAEILSLPHYVGADVEVIANSMTGTFEFEPGDTRSMPDFNVFFRHHASYPFYSDCIWFLTQMRRWGQITESKPDAWFHATAKKIYRPDVYEKAARLLVAEGRFKEADFPFGSDGYKPPTADFIDGMAYDGRKPLDYIAGFAVGLKD